MIDTTQGMAQPERARFLKERFLSRRPSICLEGALAKTRAFRETEGEALMPVAQRGHLPRAVQHVAVPGVRPDARARSGSL